MTGSSSETKAQGRLWLEHCGILTNDEEPGRAASEQTAALPRTASNALTRPYTPRFAPWLWPSLMEIVRIDEFSFLKHYMIFARKQSQRIRYLEFQGLQRRYGSFRTSYEYRYVRLL